MYRLPPDYYFGLFKASDGLAAPVTCCPLDSQGLEVQVAEEVEHGVPEEEADLVSADDGGVLVDQSTDLWEVPKNDDETVEMNLLLRRLDVTLVEVASLEVGEPSLGWGGRVAVWCA